MNLNFGCFLASAITARQLSVCLSLDASVGVELVHLGKVGLIGPCLPFTATTDKPPRPLKKLVLNSSIADVARSKLFGGWANSCKVDTSLPRMKCLQPALRTKRNIAILPIPVLAIFYTMFDRHFEEVCHLVVRPGKEGRETQFQLRSELIGTGTDVGF